MDKRVLVFKYSKVSRTQLQTWQKISAPPKWGARKLRISFPNHLQLSIHGGRGGASFRVLFLAFDKQTRGLTTSEICFWIGEIWKSASCSTMHSMMCAYAISSCIWGTKKSWICSTISSGTRSLVNSSPRDWYPKSEAEHRSASRCAGEWRRPRRFLPRPAVWKTQAPCVCEEYVCLSVKFTIWWWCWWIEASTLCSTMCSENGIKKSQQIASTSSGLVQVFKYHASLLIAFVSSLVLHIGRVPSRSSCSSPIIPAFFAHHILHLIFLISFISFPSVTVNQMLATFCLRLQMCHPDTFHVSLTRSSLLKPTCGRRRVS